MSCSAGVCSPTAKQAVLNVNDLTNMLVSGDVKITTGAGAVTITVESPFSWTSTSRLTLDAYYNVTFRAPVTVAGTGAVTIVTNDGGSGGDLIFFPGAKLDFWDTSGILVINGQNYKLVSSIRNLAGTVARSPSGHFAIAKDYDASADGVYKRTPIATNLLGIVDGLGHTIYQFAAKTRDAQGAPFALLGIAKSGAAIRNLTMANVSISIRGASNVATFVAENEGATLFNLHLTGSVQGSGSPNVGGIVGDNCGVLSGSDSSASVFGEKAKSDLLSIGGLVGVNSCGQITTSAVEGQVFGASGRGQVTVGGIAGVNAGSITDSHTSANVDGGAERYIYGGGLVGANSYTGQISASYSAANVSVGGGQLAYAGGLVGQNNGHIDNCYSLANAMAGYSYKAAAGGLVGFHEDGYGAIGSSYSNCLCCL
jgi:hypothetical protein